MEYLHTMVRVSNLEESLDFFCNKLGMSEVDRYDSDQGRFTLVYLAAPGDVERAKADSTPIVELTYNWDPEEYTGGRNFALVHRQVHRIAKLHIAPLRLGN